MPTTAGGYPELPFMEDYELVLRARACGGPFAIRTLPLPVSTSARRWEMHGVIINSLINQVCVCVCACEREGGGGYDLDMIASIALKTCNPVGP